MSLEGRVCLKGGFLARGKSAYGAALSALCPPLTLLWRAQHELRIFFKGKCFSGLNAQLVLHAPLFALLSAIGAGTEPRPQPHPPPIAQSVEASRLAMCRLELRLVAP
jgi:hypothetical protein